jgi:RHS repeat-associated protein
LTFSQTLNARQRPETLQLKNGTGSTLQSLTYGYSAAGDVTWILDGVDGADTVNNLTYDGLHRLKTANGIWGSYSYTYDGLNNLISRTSTNPLNYGYDAATNRLSGVSGAVSRNYGYNPRGGMIGDGTKSFTLNANDQITSITGIATYGYDGNGKRIKTTKADGSVEYAFYDPSGTLMYVDRPGGSHTIYLSIDGNTIAELINWNPIYLHPDLLGSPRLGTNASGSTVWREHYGPYGEKLNGVNDKIGYTGHAYDAESQLTYAQARFYDPAVGRFMSMDPIGFTGSPFTFNRYSYGNNNPFAYVDPTGMYSCSGSEFECGAIDDFVSTISMALTTLDPKSDAFQKVSTVVNYLGTAGDKNGVTIKASSLPSRVLASADKNNTINVDVSQVSKFSSNYSKANPTMSPSDLKSATGAGAVAHEARHEVDFTKSGYPNTKQAEYRTELNAYRTQADVFQGLGFHTGLGYPGMTGSEQDKAISNAAQVSTDARCAQGGPC